MDPYGKNVDLLWGVFKENTSSVIGSNDLTGGKVWGNEGATINNYGTTNVNMFKQQKDQESCLLSNMLLLRSVVLMEYRLRLTQMKAMLLETKRWYL